MNFITGDQFGGIVRAILATGLGWAAGKGYIDTATGGTISAALVTIAVSVWSYYTNTPFNVAKLK